MLKIRVSRFGPIVEGEVSLAPLTVFVGPNNSGKSYFSMLVYALFNAPRFPGTLRFVVRRQLQATTEISLGQLFAPPGYSPSAKSLNAVKRWLGKIRKFPEERRP